MNFLSSIFNFYFLQEIFFDSSFLQEKMKKNEGVLQPVFFSLSFHHSRWFCQSEEKITTSS